MPAPGAADGSSNRGDAADAPYRRRRKSARDVEQEAPAVRRRVGELTGLDGLAVPLERVRSRPRLGDGHGAGFPWLGMPIADLGSLDRALVIGSFLRKDHPLAAERL